MRTVQHPPRAHPCRDQNLTKWGAPKWSWSGLSIIRSYQSLADISRQTIRTPGLGWRNRGLHLSSSDFTERWSGSELMLQYYLFKERRGKKSNLSLHRPYPWGQQQQSELIMLPPKRCPQACQKANSVVPKHENLGVTMTLPQPDRMFWIFFCPLSASPFHLPLTLIWGLSFNISAEIQISRMWLNALYLLMKLRGPLKVKLE